MSGNTFFPLLLLALTCSATAVTAQRTEISAGTTPTASSQRILICDFIDEQGDEFDVKNARFFLNETNVLDLTDRQYVENEERGTLMFEMTQELEGFYTCNNESARVPLSYNSLPVVASPIADTSVPHYYVQPAGGSVEMMCGIKQGALGSLYDAAWYQGFSDVERSKHDRVEVRREKLEDFTLTISPLTLTDSRQSGGYVCDVTITLFAGTAPISSEEIVILVYQDPLVSFLSGDQMYIIHPNEPIPSVTFSCDATGFPHLQIQWFHNDNLVLPENEDFTTENVTTPDENGLTTAAQSNLTAKAPRLANSGKITCQASIVYNREENGEMGEDADTSNSLSRSLTVLDSSLEPIPYATQDGDLLVRMDLDSSVMIPGVTKIRLRTIPGSSDRESLEVPVDDVFFEGSRFYAFVPASRLKFRQFHVQVALVVDGETGPFSPAEVTESQYVDYDDEDSDKRLLYLVTPVCVTVVMGIIVVGVLLATTYLIYDRRHACDRILKFIMSELRKERERAENGTFNKEVFDYFKGMMQQIVDVKKKICGFTDEKDTRKTWTCCCYQAVPQQRRGEEAGGEGGGGRIMEEGGEVEEEHVVRVQGQVQLVKDGPRITAEEGRRLILELIDDIEQELKCRKFSRQTTSHHA